MTTKVNEVPIRPIGRERVYDVIDGERDYQEAGEGNAKRHADAPPNLSVGENILCMEQCLADARAAWYKPDGGTNALPFIRKVAALGVQALENFGAPPREYHVPVSANITGEMHAIDKGDVAET
jgi:hypothetical protein